MNNFHVSIVYSVFFIAAIVFSILINGLFLKFSRTLGIRNQSDTIIRWGSQSKPSLGGISFYILFLFSITFYPFFFDDYQLKYDKHFLGLLVSCSLGFLIGLADDAYNTKPFLKFIGQLTCALILISTGTVINMFSYEPLNILLTIFWVIGIMNSINMLDNMDAITSIVSIFILIAAITSIIINGAYSNVHLLILTSVIAALVGFLVYNWHPSRIYMGDTGSQFLGILLAAIGINYLWNGVDGYGNSLQSKQILMVLMVFALPIIDTTTVTINRLAQGKSPFVGGKDHTTHNLSYLGFSDRKVAIIFASIAVISIIIFTTILYIKTWNYWHVSIFGIYFLLLFTALYYPTRIKRS